MVKNEGKNEKEKGIGRNQVFLRVTCQDLAILHAFQASSLSIYKCNIKYILETCLFSMHIFFLLLIM